MDQNRALGGRSRRDWYAAGGIGIACLLSQASPGRVCDFRHVGFGEAEQRASVLPVSLQGFLEESAAVRAPSIDGPWFNTAHPRMIKSIESQ